MLNFHKRKLDFVLDDESCIVKLIVFTRYNVSVNFLSPAFDEFELEFKLFFFHYGLLQKHFDICRKLPVVCTNKCGLKDIPREKVCFTVVSS